MDQNWLSMTTNSALYQARLRELSRPRPRRDPDRAGPARSPGAPRWSRRVRPRRSVVPVSHAAPVSP